jgi:hypothetical protein
MLGEVTIVLDDLSEDESKAMFNGSISAKELRNPNSKTISEQIDDLVKYCYGHPLSIELVARNVISVEELEHFYRESRFTAVREVNWATSEERHSSIRACFEYSTNKLRSTLKDLLPKLLIFRSPFPASAAAILRQRLKLRRLQGKQGHSSIRKKEL